MAEGILCNCLEATFRLQSRLQYNKYTMYMHTHEHMVVTPLYKTCTPVTSTYATSIVALLYNYT